MHPAAEFESKRALSGPLGVSGRSGSRAADWQVTGQIGRNWVRFAHVQLWVVGMFFSTKQTNYGSVSLHSSAALVSVQLTQVWQHAADGFSRLIRVLWGHRRPISGRACARALDQRNFRPSHPREVELGLRDLASALEGNCVNGIAGDFAGEHLELWRELGVYVNA